MAETKKNTTSAASRKKSGEDAKNKKKKPAAENTSLSGDRIPAQFLLGCLCLLLFLFQVAVLVQPEGGLPLAYRGLIQGLFGRVGYYLLFAALPYLFWVLSLKKRCNIFMRSVSTIAFVLVCGMSMQLLVPERTYANIWTAISELYVGGIEGTSAGLICGALGIAMRAVFGDILSFVVVFLICCVLLLRAMEITLTSLYKAIENRPRDIEPDREEDRRDPAEILVNQIANKRIEQKRKRRIQQQEEEYEAYDEPVKALPEANTPSSAAQQRRHNKFYDFDKQTTEADLHRTATVSRGIPDDEKIDKVMRQMEEDIDAPVAGIPERTAKAEPAAAPEAAEYETIPSSMPEFKAEAPIPDAPKRAPKAPKVSAKTEDKAKEQVAQELENAKTAVREPYSFPPIQLLKMPPRSGANGTEEMKENSRRLNETLESFNIAAHIVNVTRGPSVTRYEVELEKGVKLSKLTNCADDIALSLGASGVRIAAVPGKISVVGIEVPNRAVTMVSLREVIDSEAFHTSKGKSTFAVGKDIGGSCIIGNIAKMPHMLIAGTTGSGKSVCMNSIIISLLYKASPDDVKLIMVDPKMVELANYNGIPHLMIPVVTDPKKAAGALQWAVTEMMRRYKNMSDAGVRDLESYNSIVEAEGGQKVPQLVVIIDELADLMMVAAKEVEDSICRIAQMGRASGVHLVIATQRPSADVITGLMKANIPSRIAFSVASAMESRIILDTQGAEKLVGKGDMLFAPIGSGKPLRVQGCFVTDGEVLAVTTYVKEHFVADYDQSVLADIEKKAQQTGKKAAVSAADPEPNADELDGDELLPQAVDVVLETGMASVSMLQRRLKLGYARAARIVDEMEEKGIVGPFQGSKPRNILITKEQWESMKGGADTQLTIDDMEEPFTHEPEDMPF